MVSERTEETKSNVPDGECSHSTGGARSSSTTVSTPGNLCSHSNTDQFCSSKWRAAASMPSIMLSGLVLPSLSQPKCQLWAQAVLPNKSMICHPLAHRLQTKTWGMSPDVAQSAGLLGRYHFCACTRTSRFDEELRRNCHSNWDCRRVKICKKFPYFLHERITATWM